MSKKKKQTKRTNPPNRRVNHYLEMGTHFFAGLGYGILFIFIALGIWSNLAIPKIVTAIGVADDKRNIVFFKKARHLDQFRLTLLPEMVKTFSNHEYEIYADERARLEKIRVLESLLDKHPEARDVLYALALLYQKSGDYNKSQEYMNRAATVDPDVIK